MRELALQKRLGHASPESTRLYTHVSDAAMVADYRPALGFEAEHQMSHVEQRVDGGDGGDGEVGEEGGAVRGEGRVARRGEGDER
jgi:hypothetical protein